MRKKEIPMRRCVGCMTSKDKRELIRIAGYEGKLSVDPLGKAKGRGAYLCKNSSACLEKAYKRKALERALSMEISSEEKDALFHQIREMTHE